eukprot:GILJ01002188.1.p1 GENE.GILJ01002188.1~~GILJ01002188.1.p1  ORF type:complete len:487 (+),score=92.76 GILJ01002188.1:68-1528(+)
MGGCISNTNKKNKNKASPKRRKAGEDKIENNYVFEKEVGHGHFGTVRVAKHKITGRRYAVKTIEKRKIADEMHMLKSELDVLRSVDHPNIIKFFETYEDPVYFHLVMELCTGGELFDRVIAKGAFSEKDAALLMHKIVSAINHCHDANICHRDLKPENFLFESPDERAEIKIIDFGLSQKYSKGEEMTTVVGTPYYVAPEVLKGHYDQSCDMWSLGVITYILLCGFPPFNGNDNATIFRKIMKGDFSFDFPQWSHVSDLAKDFIRRLLTVDPKARFTAPQALQHQWLTAQAPTHSLDYNIVNSLRNYADSRKLKKEALTVMVKMLNDTEVTNLKNAFKAIDTDNSGTITYQELTSALDSVGLKVAQEEIKRILESVDFDGNGRINYSEFLAATMDRKTYLTKEKLWAAFRHFDVNGTGKITEDDLRLALQRAGKEISDADIKIMMSEADTSGDGMIEFSEFVELMTADEISPPAAKHKPSAPHGRV